MLIKNQMMMMNIGSYPSSELSNSNGSNEEYYIITGPDKKRYRGCQKYFFLIS